MAVSKSWPRSVAWLVTVASSILLASGLLVLLLNPRAIGAWLPLCVLMPWALWIAVRNLRRPVSDNGSSKIQ
jgi:hypothetical protein